MSRRSATASPADSTRCTVSKSAKKPWKQAATLSRPCAWMGPPGSRARSRAVSVNAGASRCGSHRATSAAMSAAMGWCCMTELLSTWCSQRTAPSRPPGKVERSSQVLSARPPGVHVQVADEVVGEVAGVGVGAVDQRGAAAMQERQAHDVQAGCGRDAAVVQDATLAVEHRHLQERQVRTEAGGPHDALDAPAAELRGQSGGG